ncbi:Transaldolase [Legionella birminghamensis]|uniref:Transaldolase n=1 Tax=Legionella birminghamensis TaxID=28083 RepID=A0A378IAD1_9GAMM|nr:transaldolase family protein [Legionella birminghamensis]KTC74360.1 Transaldolase [Legionella birminghamensis]STX31725.1 Transaldolase [Legionella birminghamensis]
MNQLEQLKQYSEIVADTGDIQLLKLFQTRDATTNPKLILDAALNTGYQPILNKILAESKQDDNSGYPQSIRFAAGFITEIGAELLQIIPGRISSELDPRLSFNTKETVRRAQYLISLYEKKGISRNRILIKIAASWEGIKAAEELEKQEIHCNLTLVFSLIQAAACAQAKATLISPFVGRLNDYFSSHNIPSPQSPGVELIQSIINYYTGHSMSTEIMAASFRDKQQVLSVAGVNLMTVPPDILNELMKSDDPVTRKLQYIASNPEPALINYSNREEFLQALAQNKAAYALLKDGIFKFTKAFLKLRQIAFQQPKIKLLFSVLSAKISQSLKM